MNTLRVTRLQKLISACAGVHILATVFLAIMMNQYDLEPAAGIPLFVILVLFPVLFTIFIANILSSKGWLVNSETIGDRKTKGHYFVIATVTVLTFLSAVSVFKFDSVAFDNSAEILNGTLYISIFVTGALMAVNTSNRKAGFVLLFLLAVTLPMTMLLTIRSLIPLVITSMPAVFYLLGFVIYPPLFLLVMQIKHIVAHCKRLKDKMGFVIPALVLGMLLLPAVWFAPSWLMNLSQGNSTAPNTGTLNSSNRVTLTSLTTNTEYDSDLGAYKTWVDLVAYNNSTMRDREYVTRFALPKGCFIIDYYLYVADERKEGLLTDKRAASTIYEREVRRNVDPGIIYYENDDMITLKVYPFGANEVRKTGFLIMHNESFTLDIDGRQVKITAAKAAQTPIDLQGVSYIPAGYMPNLESTARTPKYFFLADARDQVNHPHYIRAIKNYVDNHDITDYMIYNVSDTVSVYSGSGVVSEGEFFNLQMAVDMALVAVNAGECPVFIVSAELYTADFSVFDITDIYPESAYYYELMSAHSLWQKSLRTNEFIGVTETPVFTKTLYYKGVALNDIDRSQIIVTGVPGGYTGSAFEDAIMLYAKCSQKSIDPLEQVNLVLDSFRHQVLSPLTAFSVWETEAQVRDLYELQASMLQNPELYAHDGRQPVPDESPDFERPVATNAPVVDSSQRSSNTSDAAVSDVVETDIVFSEPIMVVEEVIPLSTSSSAPAQRLSAQFLPLKWWFIGEMRAIEWVFWDIDVIAGMNFVLSFSAGIVVCITVLMAVKHRKREA